MPDKTVYSITQTGYIELYNTLNVFIETFEYDLVPFMIAAFFINMFEKDKLLKLLTTRLTFLKKSSLGILNQIEALTAEDFPSYVVCNVKHNSLIIQAEITAVQNHIEVINLRDVW